MDFQIGVYALGGLKIFWAILPDGSNVSDIGELGLERILARIVNGLQFKDRMLLFCNAVAENTRMRVVVENGYILVVGIDNALTDEHIERIHPDDLERRMISAGYGRD